MFPQGVEMFSAHATEGQVLRSEICFVDSTLDLEVRFRWSVWFEVVLWSGAFGLEVHHLGPGVWLIKRCALGEV